MGRFSNWREANPGDYVWAGDHRLPIVGYGDVQIEVLGPQGKTRVLPLYDVICVPTLATNVVSLRELKRKGYYWDTRPVTTLLRRASGTLFCIVENRCDQFVLEYIPEEITSAAFIAHRKHLNSWVKRSPRRADARRWHLRLGHPGPDALRHLVTSSEGVRLTGIPTVECDQCAQAKIKRMIRHMPRDLSRYKPGEKLAVDFHDFEEDKQRVRRARYPRSRNSRRA